MIQQFAINVLAHKGFNTNVSRYDKIQISVPLSQYKDFVYSIGLIIYKTVKYLIRYGENQILSQKGKYFVICKLIIYWITIQVFVREWYLHGLFVKNLENLWWLSAV